MESVLRAATIYAVLLVAFRLAGRRSLAQLTNFDFVLLLIIGEATQQALIGDDFSVTTAVILIVTLIMIDIGISLWKERSKRVAKWVEGVPLILVAQGETLRDRLAESRVDEEDILEAARNKQGLHGMRDVDYAVLERDGQISILPRR